MTIVCCPRCGDKVSVPPAASPSALVQCPLCLEEYFLSDALIQLPPTLIVVGGHAPAVEKEEYRLAEPVEAAVRAAELDVGSTAAVGSRPQLRTVSRRRPQERSAIGEIVKVVLGGVAGLAGGLLVLWWGFGVDVGDLGPTVSKVQYLRFLVPPKLRAQTISPEQNPAPLDTMNADSPRTKPGSAGAGNDSQLVSDESADNPAKGKGTKNGSKQPTEDPFAAHDFPGEKSGSDAKEELKIDDPLSAVKPQNEDPTKEPKTSPEPDAAGEKKRAESEPTEEKPSKPAAEKQSGDEPKSDETKPDESTAEKPN